MTALFKNKQLVTNIRDSKQMLSLETNSGKCIITQKAEEIYTDEDEYEDEYE